MKKNITLVLFSIFSMLYSFHGYSQANKNYSNIETKNVLYYKVEEIVKMTFGGTTTRYTVSNLSLISKVNLGPDNVRIITPIYKDKNYKTKSYYVETRNLKKDLGKNQDLTDVVEIKIENSNIVIPENTKMEKIALAVAIDNLTSQKKDENQKIKSYIPKTNNSVKKTVLKSKKPATIVEIKSKTDNSRVSKSPKKDSFLLAIKNLTEEENTTNYPKKENSSEIDNLNKKSEKAPKLKPLVTAKTENKTIKIAENPKIKKIPLALPTNNPIKEAPSAVIKTETIKEKPNYISINVTDVYERVAQKGYKSAYMFKEMANQYFFKNQMEKAVKWYEELFAMNSELDPIYYYRYGEALKKTGNIQKGNAMIEKFNKLVE